MQDDGAANERGLGGFQEHVVLFSQAKDAVQWPPETATLAQRFAVLLLAPAIV